MTTNQKFKSGRLTESNPAASHFRSRMLNFAKRLAALSFCVLFVSACTMGRVAERIEYWKAETGQSLPLGTGLEDATRFFASRGLKLQCCVSGGPDISKAYWAKESEVGGYGFITYDVVVIVDFDDKSSVRQIRVQRWGVGL